MLKNIIETKLNPGYIVVTVEERDSIFDTPVLFAEIGEGGTLDNFSTNPQDIARLLNFYGLAEHINTHDSLSDSYLLDAGNCYSPIETANNGDFYSAFFFPY
jgi:hypothetical protein